MVAGVVQPQLIAPLRRQNGAACKFKFNSQHEPGPPFAAAAKVNQEAAGRKEVDPI